MASINKFDNKSNRIWRLMGTVCGEGLLTLKWCENDHHSSGAPSLWLHRIATDHHSSSTPSLWLHRIATSHHSSGAPSLWLHHIATGHHSSGAPSLWYIDNFDADNRYKWMEQNTILLTYTQRLLLCLCQFY